MVTRTTWRDSGHEEEVTWSRSASDEDVAEDVVDEEIERMRERCRGEDE